MGICGSTGYGDDVYSLIRRGAPEEEILALFAEPDCKQMVRGFSHSIV